MDELSVYGVLLLQGAWVTVKITVVASVVAVFVAFTTGIMRMSHSFFVRLLPTAFVEIFRGTPCYVQLFWVFFSLPLMGILLDAFTVSVLVLGSNVGSYGSEVVRSALAGVPRSQYEAAVALNYTPFQRFRHVTFPQALITMLPPAGNLFIDLLKLTPLTSLITVSDLTYNAILVRQQTGNTAFALGAIMLGYFLFSTFIVWCIRRLEVRVSRGMDVGVNAR
ncbi:ectoine/hydroxyectoine ABC transporter permease subunit EhuC [Pseudochelatococcus sp. B33]